LPNNSRIKRFFDKKTHCISNWRIIRETSGYGWKANNSRMVLLWSSVKQVISAQKITWIINRILGYQHRKIQPNTAHKIISSKKVFFFKIEFFEHYNILLKELFQKETRYKKNPNYFTFFPYTFTKKMNSIKWN
jgi:hypothetical protein